MFAAARAKNVPVFSRKRRTSSWKINWDFRQRLWLPRIRELGRRTRKGRDSQLHVVRTRSRAFSCQKAPVLCASRTPVLRLVATRSRAIRACSSNGERKGETSSGSCASSQGRNENGVETHNAGSRGSASGSASLPLDPASHAKRAFASLMVAYHHSGLSADASDIGLGPRKAFA